ncbi:hypothetical protein HDU93_007481 [Gonapodya sp. JEL0774]|nr:hypothetical protein HDU93_007481 [Gonapodya sp. JEL0774]
MANTKTADGGLSIVDPIAGLSGAGTFSGSSTDHHVSRLSPNLSSDSSSEGAFLDLCSEEKRATFGLSGNPSSSKEFTPNLNSITPEHPEPDSESDGFSSPSSDDGDAFSHPGKRYPATETLVAQYHPASSNGTAVRSAVATTTKNLRTTLKEPEVDIYENPDLYGLRRSGRSKPAALRYDETTADDSESEDRRSRRKKFGGVRRGGGGENRKRRRGDDDDDDENDDVGIGEDGSDSIEDSGSDDGYGVKGKKKRDKIRRKGRRSAVPDDDDAIATLDGHLRFSMRSRPQRNYNERAMGEDAGLTSSDEDEGKKRKRLTQEEMLTEEGEAVDKVLDWKVEKKKAEPGEEEEEEDDDETMMFLIKWVGRSHLHNTWESFESLRDFKGFQRVKNFIKKKIEPDAAIRADPTVSKEEIEQLDIRLDMEREMLEDCKSVDRVIAWRQRSDGGIEYYCKWRRLDYSECTWESAEAISPLHQACIDAFLSREESVTVPHRSIQHRNHRPPFKPQLEQPRYMVGGTLRDYQLMGVNWAVKLWHQNENGILADEMGLGKTLQSISVLNYLFHDERVRLYGPFLVVVPLSTIGSWQREFARWAPDINVIVYTGDPLSREIIREYEFSFNGGKAKGKLKFNVLLTTYEIALKDESVFRGIQWAYLAVDEAHRLKNQESQLHEALSRFNVTNRLLITGTPLQASVNNVQELLSLVKFLMPGKAAELENINISIADDSDNQSKIREFHRLLTPYMCRRLKKDVEKDLPSKTERILRVELAPLQVKYYRSILTRNYEELIRSSGRPRSLLNIVMELKKTSDHAYLIDGADDFNNTSKEERLRALVTNSGKMVLLDKLLTRLKEDGHRVLIFSQLVMMLNLLSDYMSLRGFAFQRLDGSIPSEARKRAIESFNAPNSPDFAFLLSTRAGGLGINLETADTVILFDSDWNPQNDLQAMARAHRIGQTKHVNVYRFISKDTIEEDILERAKRKMVLEFALIKQMEAKGGTLTTKKTPGSQTDPDKYSKSELEAILKFGAEKLFKDTENNQSKLDELNLDDILARAEHHETTTGEEDEGMEFMEQWKVQDFGVTQLGWDDIIPEEERKKAQDDLKYEEEQRRKQQTSGESYSRAQKTSGASSAVPMDMTSGKDLDDGSKRQRSKTGQKKSKSAGAVDVLTATDIRALVRGLMKFGDAPERFDRVLEEGDLANKRPDIVQDNKIRLISACKEAVRIAEAAKKTGDKVKSEEPADDGEQHAPGKKGSRMTSIEFGGVNPINAGKLVTRLEDLAVLHDRLQKKNLESFRLPVEVKGVQSGWNCPWGVKDDSMLLVGIYKYGYGSWEKMQEDPKLGFESKFFINDDDDDAKKKPQSIHLERRADTLIRAWKAEMPLERSEKAGLKVATKPKKMQKPKEPTSPSSKKPTGKSSAREDSPPAKARKARPSDGTKEVKDKFRSEETRIHNLAKESKRKRVEEELAAIEKRKKRKELEAKRRSSGEIKDSRPLKSRDDEAQLISTTNSSMQSEKKAELQTTDSRAVFKEKMRGVRKQLKEFGDVPDNINSKAKMAYLWPRLKEVVTHLEQIVAQESGSQTLERGLWEYVAEHWVLLNVDGEKMKDFYGKLKKKMEHEGSPDASKSTKGVRDDAKQPKLRDRIETADHKTLSGIGERRLGHNSLNHRDITASDKVLHEADARNQRNSVVDDNGRESEQRFERSRGENQMDRDGGVGAESVTDLEVEAEVVIDFIVGKRALAVRGIRTMTTGGSGKSGELDGTLMNDEIVGGMMAET